MNTLKSFVRNIAERTEERKAESPTLSGGNAEGFLCPICMQSFDNPEALQSHFLSEHECDTSNNHRSSLEEEEDSLEQSFYSEESSTGGIRKTPSGSERLDASSDYSLLSTSKLPSPKDEIRLTEEHAAKIHELEARIQSLSQSLLAKEMEIEQKEDELRVEALNFKDTVQSKSDEIHLLQESINALKCDKNDFVESESARISELRSNYEKSQKDLCQQSEVLNDLKKKCEEERLEKEQLQHSCHERDNKILASDKLIEELRSQMVQFEEDRTKLLREIELGEGTNMALDQLKQENETLSKQIKSGKSTSEKMEKDLGSQVSSLSQELIEAKSKSLSLTDSLKESNDKVCRSSTDLEEKSSANKELSQELKSKRQEIDGFNKKYKELESKLNQASEKNLEVSIEKNKFATKAEKLTKSLEDLKKSNSHLQDELKEKGTMIEDLWASKETLSKDKSDLENQLAAKEKEALKLVAEAEKVAAEKDCLSVEMKSFSKDLQTENSKLKSDLQSVSMERQGLEERICSIQKGYEVEIEELNQKLNDAKISIDSFSFIKEKYLEKLKVLESTCSCLKKEKESLSEEFKVLTNELKKSVAKLEKEKSERVNFYEDKIRDLSSCLEKATNDLNELKCESEEFERTREKLEKSVGESLSSRDSLLSQKLELEAQVGACNDERKALLERCLGAQTELDRSRSNCIELRRKLDDSQAALHELGRENQSIQLELNKLTGRKWADDSDVKDCAGCKNQFSLTIRKHHCRNCGQIFCKDCSAKTSSNMTNYSKPQRVCDGCFEELAIK